MFNKNFWIESSKIIDWVKKPELSYKKKRNNFLKWFPGAKIDVFHNCITKNISFGKKDKIAIHYINKNKNIKSYTYKQLYNLTCNFAQVLEKRNYDYKKDKIVIHGSSSIETTVAIFACIKIGIHFSVIFEDLSSGSTYFIT